MSLCAFLRFLSTLFRRFTQIFRQANVVGYSRKLWSLIMMAMQRLFRLRSASSHEARPLPIYKSSTPPVDVSANATLTIMEGGTTTNVPLASVGIVIRQPHEMSPSVLEGGQQDHREITSPSSPYPSGQELPQIIYVASEEQSQSRSPRLLKPIFPWSSSSYASRYKRFSVTALFLSPSDLIEKTSISSL